MSDHSQSQGFHLRDIRVDDDIQRWLLLLEFFQPLVDHCNLISQGRDYWGGTHSL